jgi:hypothetical protein
MRLKRSSAQSHTTGAALMSATLAAVTKQPTTSPRTSTIMWHLRPLTRLLPSNPTSSAPLFEPV